MAVMIPDAVAPDIKSNAERSIFGWFRDAKGTEDWVVLHSLGISEHQNVIHGETDFLVLAPGLGMFALEVKGGRIERKNGKWRFINRYGEITEKIRGPFDQAWDGIYSIKEFVKERLDDSHLHLNHILFGIGVMFPDIDYIAEGTDQEQWQIFTIQDGNGVKAYIERLSTGAQKKCAKKGNPMNLPSREDVDFLADLLRGNFEYDIPLRARQKYAEENIRVLTGEQAKCLDGLEDNQRTLIRGCAGTGKTVLAVMAAKKYAEQGEKVALFCFNRLLGNWLESRFSGEPLNRRPAFVGSFHSYMHRLAVSQRIYRETPDLQTNPHFFETELPNLLLTAMTDFPVRYDRIIVDEAQDLLFDLYLDVMDRSLENGLAHGKWNLFGDFSRQAIYAPGLSEVQLLERLERRGFFTVFRLIRNCRNTRKICIDIENILGIPENAAFDDSIDTPAVDHIVYRDQAEQKEKLVRLLSTLLAGNIRRSDIVLLSPRKYSDSVVSRLQEIPVEKYTHEPAGKIRFSTIQAFKGLESAVIVLTDIESYRNENLIYVGLSRARFALYVLESQQACGERRELFAERRLRNV